MQEEIRESLLSDIRREALLPTLILLFGVGFALAALDLPSPRTWSPWMLGLAAIALAVIVWVLRERSPILAAWLLTAGLVPLILLVWQWFPDANLQHLFVLPILSGAILLGWWACLALSGASTVLLLAGTIWLGLAPWRAAADISVLWLVVVLMSIALRIEQVTLTSLSNGYEEARRHLAQARNQQLELKQALADLALAHRETDRLNRLLTAATQAVEEAQRTKEEFVANVSHELRTPLNMIIGFSEMIGGSPETYSRHLPPALLADVAAIQRNSQHLASLVNDVLELAEAEAGRTQLLEETVSIGEIIAEAIEAVSVLYEQKGLYLRSEISPNLPTVFCDRTRIRQVILNLLSNAGRFTDKGGATVEARREQNMVQITVADTGPGMDANTSARLFQPFQQDQAMRRRFGGTGLGLAISKKFVELHGGRIWLKSEPGQGTQVSFTLPLAPPPIEKVQRWFSPYQEYIPRSGPSHAPKMEAKACVVLVEQGQALSQFVRRHLEGMEAISVRTLEEARQTVEDHGALAIVINGAAPIAWPASPAPAMRFDVPILYCSLPERRQVGGLAVQEYLVKPIMRETLLEALRRVAPGGHTILLADDDADLRQLFGRMLGSAAERYALLQAEDGEATLALLHKRHPDVLLLDLMMPGSDGFSVLAAKAQDEDIRDIPVIVISAHDAQSKPIQCESLVVTRSRGLAASDLAAALRALMQALEPRFGAVTPPGKPPATPACG